MTFAMLSCNIWYDCSLNMCHNSRYLLLMKITFHYDIENMVSVYKYERKYVLLFVWCKWNKDTLDKSLVGSKKANKCDKFQAWKWSLANSRTQNSELRNNLFEINSRLSCLCWLHIYKNSGQDSTYWIEVKMY